MSKVLLIVDDEPANIDLIKGLVPADYKCKAAIKGQIALKQIAKQKPDMVILDLIMPEMDGLQTLKELRREHDQASLPVLIISGTKDPDKLSALQQLGISGFLLKPIDGEEFLTYLSH